MNAPPQQPKCIFERIAQNPLPVDLRRWYHHEEVFAWFVSFMQTMYNDYDSLNCGSKEAVIVRRKRSRCFSFSFCMITIPPPPLSFSFKGTSML
jgi:hypothetical protein